MPHSVESLRNVKKDSREHAFVYESFFNDVRDTMHLVDCRVIFPEIKLALLQLHAYEAIAQ
jgi:hypothetical protein